MCGKGRSTGSWKTHLGRGTAEVAKHPEVWKSAPGQRSPACVRVSGKKNGACKRKREGGKERPCSWQVHIDPTMRCRRPDASLGPNETCKNLHLTFHKHWLYGRWACPVIYFASCRCWVRRISRIILSDACTRLGWAIAKWLCRIGWTSTFWAKQRSLLYSSSGKLRAIA